MRLKRGHKADSERVQVKAVKYSRIILSVAGILKHFVTCIFKF